VDEVLAVLAQGSGVALLRDLRGAGLDPDEVRALLRAGTITRIRRGAYADARLWRSLDPVGKHLLLCRAVLASLKPPVVLSHVSAALAHGLPVWGVDLGRVHVTRPVHGQGRREAGVVHHVGVLPLEQVEDIGGLAVTRADRAVLDLARVSSFESGVVTADAALHRELTTPQGLLALHTDMLDWPGARVAGRVVAFADRLAESPGESRTRVLFHVHGLPTPRLQVEIRANGRLYRVDLLVDEPRTVFEFDGRLKYRMGASQNPRELERILWAEKRREDDIRAEGFRFGRITWSDLDQGQATAARVRRTIWGPGAGQLGRSGAGLTGA
jgi:hypothetical protein